MLPTVTQELIALNDRQLEGLIRAEERAVEQAIERLIVEAQPVTDGILAHYTRSTSLLSREDAEDIRSSVHMRLVVKLRAVPQAANEAIQSYRGYVAALTHNAVKDHLRDRFPERARLKSRLRYALQNDARLALWPSSRGPLCGLAEWKGREDLSEELPADLAPAIAAIPRDAAAEALLAVARQAGRPVLFEAALDLIAEAWNVIERAAVPLDSIAEQAAHPARIDDIDFVRSLWSEILVLRPMQRKALLMNLRCGSDTNVVSLLILGRIARFDEIAAALEMTRDELTALWKSLPMEDAQIAERFGITRQQVINLRKAARDRLSRRLRR